MSKKGKIRFDGFGNRPICGAPQCHASPVENSPYCKFHTTPAPKCKAAVPTEVETLTAELAALRAERDAMKKANDDLQDILQGARMDSRAIYAERDALRDRAERAESDAAALRFQVTALEAKSEKDWAEFRAAESDAAESKRRCGDVRDQINIALAQFLSGVIARYRQGETIMCASEAESWMEANFDPLTSAAALTPEASK